MLVKNILSKFCRLTFGNWFDLNMQVRKHLVEYDLRKFTVDRRKINPTKNTLTSDEASFSGFSLSNELTSE